MRTGCGDLCLCLCLLPLPLASAFGGCLFCGSLGFQFEFLMENLASISTPLMDAIKVMRYVANEADSVWFLLQQLDDDVAYGQPSRWSLFLAAWITTLLLPHTHAHTPPSLASAAQIFWPVLSANCLMELADFQLYRLLA